MHLSGRLQAVDGSNRVYKPKSVCRLPGNFLLRDRLVTAKSDGPSASTVNPETPGCALRTLESGLGVYLQQRWHQHLLALLNY